MTSALRRELELILSAAQDEGEPATADRQAFTSAAFGDIFDVLVASEQRAEALDAYRAVVVGGRVEWTPTWGQRLKAYAQKGGTVVLNAAQVKGLPEDLLGVRSLGSTGSGRGSRRWEQRCRRDASRVE